MNPQLRRLLITLAVVGLAASVVLIIVVERRGPTPAAPAAGRDAGTAASAPPEPEAGARTGDEAAGESTTTDDAPAPPLDPPQPIEGLHAVWVDDTGAPDALGSLDRRQSSMYVELAGRGAGIERLTLSRYWLTAAASHQAREHYEALRRGAADPPPLPPDDQRYVLREAQPFAWVDAAGQARMISVPLLAAHSIEINGTTVSLIGEQTDEDGTTQIPWKQTAPGVFEATIANGDNRPVARVERHFSIDDDYQLTLIQRISNLTKGTLAVRWVQYGPGDLTADRSRYLDMRRFRFGFLPDPAAFPNMVASGNGDLLVDRRKSLKRFDKAIQTQDPARRAELLSLWPNETSRKKGYALSWFAATNRYFALGVYPDLKVLATDNVQGSRSIEDVIESIRLDASGPEKNRTLFTGMYSPVHAMAAGEATSFDLGVYAGPLRRDVLGEQQPLVALKMKGLILYQMSSWCAVCTFQWLAHGLLAFLSSVHFVIGDWGVAIILLVVVVRVMLHPLTKKAQISMQRFGKVMSDIKPEIDKLQKKYTDDPKKLQQEQMRLMRERGVNPVQFLGCLPMFLQMPIWIALYAMLYFAFELRHQPAFWGIFQLFWDWPFLADLSSADHCFWEFPDPFKFLLWNVTGVNLLPFLLGIVFFIQQKYMSPPPSPSMTPEQVQQQKIMKIMMVVLFPLMLYSAPSGLTLYICTSSFLGIIESRYIRQHIKEMDLASPPGKKAVGNKPKRKPKDLQARMYADALERAKQKRKPPPKKYKKRK